MGVERMGAQIQIEHGYVVVKAERGLHGARVHLDLPTVTGTENLMMAAALADGTTVIENAACEPEVVDLANFLIKRGAKIHGAGTDRVTVEGVTHLEGAEYGIMPDRIEAGTFLIACSMTQGDILVKRASCRTMEVLVRKLKESGVKIREEGEALRVSIHGELKAVDVKTMPYPGFPTDMQAQMMSLMAIARGLSVITETVFESRFTHVSELKRMGADIKIQETHAIVQGVKQLSGAPVMASDLRASACLILAGLAAEGETEVSRIYHLDRGYERIELKLSQLGAKICRVKGNP
jgi:UDP-N-acetylglucosamine 1-carboxyvinyltransferase